MEAVVKVKVEAVVKVAKLKEGIQMTPKMRTKMENLDITRETKEDQCLMKLDLHC